MVGCGMGAVFALPRVAQPKVLLRLMLAQRPAPGCPEVFFPSVRSVSLMGALAVEVAWVGNVVCFRVGNCVGMSRCGSGPYLRLPGACRLFLRLLDVDP